MYPHPDVIRAQIDQDEIASVAAEGPLLLWIAS